MARLSYGGDIFSPLRSDLSLNESSCKDGRSGRGSISEDLKASALESSKSINSTSGLEVPGHDKKKDCALPLKEVTQRRKNEKARSKSSKGKVETISILPCVKDENIDSELPLKQLRRSKRTLKSGDGIAKEQIDSKDLNSSNKSVSSQSSKTKKTNLVHKFITVRDREVKNEQIENSTESCSISISSSQSENIEEKDGKADYLEDSNEIAVHESWSGEIKGKITTLASDLPIQSNQDGMLPPLKEIYKLDLKSSSDGDDSESKKNLQNTISPIGEVLPNDPAKIQIKTIEKLISDTVNVEFDILRQQMYLQQVSLLKVLNETRAEFENKYSRDTEELYKIIDVLLEENRQLRTAILARQ